MKQVPIAVHPPQEGTGGFQALVSIGCRSDEVDMVGSQLPAPAVEERPGRKHRVLYDHQPRGEREDANKGLATIEVEEHRLVGGSEVPPPGLDPFPSGKGRRADHRRDQAVPLGTASAESLQIRPLDSEHQGRAPSDKRFR